MMQQHLMQHHNNKKSRMCSMRLFLLLCNLSYFATFSRRFIIANMNNAESKHNTMNTAHT